jgi:hypothetical protein
MIGFLVQVLIQMIVAGVQLAFMVGVLLGKGAAAILRFAARRMQEQGGPRRRGDELGRGSQAPQTGRWRVPPPMSPPPWV